jgi:hypothetical protein
MICRLVFHFRAICGIVTAASLEYASQIARSCSSVNRKRRLLVPCATSFFPMIFCALAVV